MNRRQALAHVSMILGGSLIGSDLFLRGCTPTAAPPTSDLGFTEGTLAFLDEVGETILPTTASSPGARAAGIGDFMKTIVTDCYEEEDQQIFMEGIDTLNEAAQTTYGNDFVALAADEREALLVEIDEEAMSYAAARQPGDPNHYFTMVKQLTLWGYFSSEVGATQALRYIETPGRYEGCIDYKKGDKAWAI